MALGVGIGERIGDAEEGLRRAMECETDKMRVSMPGRIVSFDSEKQTATVQPLIKEQIQGEWVSIPPLLDVPCYFPRAGGYCLTFPVKPEDEVLVIFNDMSVDAWWQSGGEQTQLEIRRHDLSDAMALLGITSVPRAVRDYSTRSVVLRNEDNDSYFEITDDRKTINIIGAEHINITAADEMRIKSGGAMYIDSDTSIAINAPRVDINNKYPD